MSGGVHQLIAQTAREYIEEARKRWPTATPEERDEMYTHADRLIARMIQVMPVEPRRVTAR